MEQKELNILQEKSTSLQKIFNGWLSVLNDLDSERVKHTQELLQAKTSGQVADACAKLYHQTEKSLIALTELEEAFQKVIRVNQEIKNIFEKDTPSFNSYLNRFSLLGDFILNNLHKIKNIRKKQLTYIGLLTKNLDGINHYFSRIFYKRNINKINSCLSSEIELLRQIQIKEEANVGQIKEFITALQYERKWKIVVYSLATFFIFTPIPFISLPGLALLKSYDFLNRYTENYQRLKNLNLQLLEKQWA